MKNRWMDTETFHNFFKNIHPDRLVVLIYDGHVWHISIGLIEKARQENVVILKLPPHISHILQTMDFNIFRPLKLLWNEELIKW